MFLEESNWRIEYPTILESYQNVIIILLDQKETVDKEILSLHLFLLLCVEYIQRYINFMANVLKFESVLKS